MRIVVDTNVVISAWLNEGRVPDRVLGAIVARGDWVLYDDRIVAEYRSVMARPKFRRRSLDRGNALIDELIAHGMDVGRTEPWLGEMVDSDDRIFVEVALAGKADIVLTGNAKHYAVDLGFRVVGPTQLFRALAGGISEV